MQLCILHLLSQTQMTGVEAYVISLAEAQTKEGHKIFIISEAFHLKTKLPFTSMPVHSARNWARWRGIYELYKFIRKEKIDIVNAHSRIAVKWAWFATRLTKCALVSTIHGVQHKSLGKRLWDIYGERVIVISENLKLSMCQKFKMREERIQILSNPISIPNLGTIKPSPKTWVLIGRLTGPKGERAQEFIENILPIFLERDKELHFELLGGHWEKDNHKGLEVWQNLKKKYPKQVLQKGPISNLEKKIAEAGLVFGAGRIAITALATARPLIAFGEVQYLGRIDAKNYTSARASNFGDIGLKGLSTKLELQRVIQDIEEFLQKENDPLLQKERIELSIQVKKDYDLNEISKKIIEIYKSARLLKKHPHHIPVLMYHQVLEKKEMEEAQKSLHKIFIQKENLEKHLKLFKKTKIQTLGFEDLYKYKNGLLDLETFPKKPLVLTFDDGYRNMLNFVAPLLQKYNFKAVLYLLADLGVCHNVWDAGESPLWPLLSKKERQDIFESKVFEIGSHGFRHEKITKMNEFEAMEELMGSRKALEKEFGKKIFSFAFTFGVKNNKSSELAKSAGYEYGLNTDQGAFHVEEDPFHVFRIPIFPKDSRLTLIKKISSSYRKRFWKTRKR